MKPRWNNNFFSAFHSSYLRENRSLWVDFDAVRIFILLPVIFIVDALEVEVLAGNPLPMDFHGLVGSLVGRALRSLERNCKN